MTAVAALKCVELGLLDLDDDIRPKLPTMGERGIMTTFDNEDANNAATATTPNTTPITTRMLLTHTCGSEYDWLNPQLTKWKVSRGELPWSGATVEEKYSTPLIYKPGTSFSYGGGSDWAGKLIEVVSGMSLEEFMSKHIWTPLGIQEDTTFSPSKNKNLEVATMSTLDEKGQPPAVASDFDPVTDVKDCIGGAGLYTSCESYYAFLSALLRRKPKLLTGASYHELFRPQLNDDLEESFNQYLYSSPERAISLPQGIPATVRKNFSFAGMICKEAVPGRSEKDTVIWGGLPCMTWWIDGVSGICGTVFCQIIPAMHPGIMALHEQCQRGCMMQRIDRDNGWLALL